MKSYSELNGTWVYDWPTIIDDLEAGRYGIAARREVTRAADSWVTCACGNQCAALKRGGHGFPLDEMLSDLGGEFAHEIDMLAGIPSPFTAQYAREILEKIETRAAELLSEQP